MKNPHLRLAGLPVPAALVQAHSDVHCSISSSLAIVVSGAAVVHSPLLQVLDLSSLRQSFQKPSGHLAERPSFFFFYPLSHVLLDWHFLKDDLAYHNQ